MDVAIIGGGAAGLACSRLLKLRSPGWRVRLYERNQPDDTFGFGIGLAAAPLDRLRAVDAVAADAVAAHTVDVPSATFLIGDEATTIHARGQTIARAKLLGVLTTQARDAGVELHLGAAVSLEDVADADVVVAADGSRSKCREALRDEVGASIEEGHLRYIWCGVEGDVQGSTFAVRTTASGVVIGLRYPYAAGRTAFVGEMLEDDWREAGFDAFDEATPPGADDEQSMKVLGELYADVLDGGSLVGNRSRWQRFRTVRLDRWHHGNVVFLGDAAHTAHPSVGSGTKLAIDDALVLAEALCDEASPADAFRRYEAARRPVVERLQRLAARSVRWWESMGSRIELHPARVALSYMSRTGGLTAEEVLGLDEHCTRRAAEAFLGRPLGDEPLVPAILASGLSAGTRTLDCRLVGRAVSGMPAPVPLGTADAAAADALYVEVSSPEAAGAARQEFPSALLVGVVAALPGESAEERAAVVAEAVAFQAAGCDGVRLQRPTGDDLVPLLEVGEELRGRKLVVAVTASDGEVAEAGLAVLAGRVDLVAVP